MSGTERLNVALAGRYRIEKQLGQGGMATVYLAQDIKHDRKVAVKVLKPELAAVLGAERFVVEIKTTAALQHPHILPLFDSGTADGFLYYVMPYIEGETLRGKLNRETQFSVDEAVRITAQVADALDYAHRHGVIHRDIKPENILLHDGRPMVADFGIALAVSAAAGGRMTETGLSLGTPHYMSPEQATAEKDITARSDIYSLASVLYEMLAGAPPHMGASAQQIIMKIITEQAAPVTNLRKAVPPNVAAALAKALEKLPADRFETAKLFAEALLNRTFTSATFAEARVLGLGSRVLGPPFVVAVSVAVIAVVAAAIGWLRPEPVLPVTRLDLSLGTLTAHPSSDVVISPDGSTLALVGIVGQESGIYVRRLGGDPDFRRLPGTESVVGSPTFSPDNQWIAFRRNIDGTLMKMLVSGGGATTIARLGSELGTFLHWGTDEHIVYSGGPAGLYRIPAIGGTPEYLEATVGAARYSFLLPDGSGVLFARGAGVWVYSFKADSATELVPNAVHPTYVSTGHLLYIGDGGGLFALPFDLKRHRVRGQPVRVLDGVAAGLTQRGYSVSRDGALVYHEGPSTLQGGDGAPNRFLIVGPGKVVDTVRLPPGRHLMPRFSPSGRSIAYEFATPGRAGATDINTFDLVTGTNTQLTFDADNDNPVWSPDGKQIVFAKTPVTATGEDLWIKPADNSGPEKPQLAMPGIQNPTAWFGDTILFASSGTGQQMDLFTYPLKDGGKPKPYLEAPWNESDFHVSRDGKLAVFASRETGPVDVWVRDFPVPLGKWRVSQSGGVVPRWSPDGRYVYYWKPAVLDSLFRVRIDRTPAVVLRNPELVYAVNVAGLANWDLHPDGTRFIIAVDVVAAAPSGGPAVSRYVVALNWFADVRALSAKVKQ